MKVSVLIYLLPFLVSFISCRGQEAEAELTRFSVEQKTLDFEDMASVVKVVVYANKEYSALVDDSGKDWCGVKIQNGFLFVNVEQNPDKELRQTSIKVVCAEKQEIIKVRQLGWGKNILLSENAFSLPFAGGAFKLAVTANVEYEFDMKGAEWIEKLPSTKGQHDAVTSEHIFSVGINKGESKRSAVIVVKDKEASSIAPVNISVSQDGYGEYVAPALDGIEDDIKLRVLSAAASSYQTGEEIEKSYDGDMNTLYHSKWDNSAPDYFPITLQYNFEDKTDIDYFIYYPRTSVNPNGNFKEVEISVKCRGGDNPGIWKTVIRNDFGGLKDAAKIVFPSKQINVESVRFKVISGAGDGQGFASCAEMEFYKYNADNFDPFSLFTDRSCSELKPDITDVDIEKCKFVFFKNLAYYMKKGDYPSQSRIMDFKAYPHPTIFSSQNKIAPYSLYDNVTGIYVEPGEELVVMTENLYGRRNIQLMIRDLNVPGGDGFWGQQFTLYEGINKIKPSKGGLVYVAYYERDYQNAPIIKLHFAGGRINGYFDISKHSDADWNRLLDKASYAYFDVIGKYSHLTYPASIFRAVTKGNGVKLIGCYDKLVYNEWSLMGLLKYDRIPVNKMHFIVVYKGYMYSTSYYTAYSEETLYDIADPDKFSTSACWGPAHEVGHSNQTRPGFKWLGTAEVTNNIFSEYIQTSIFNQPSRLQVEDMRGGLPNRYAKAWRDILAPAASHANFGTDSDVFCKLVPFWQLQLYFGKVLGRTPEEMPDKGGFYPEVFEIIRTSPDLPTAGEQQTEFVYTCSKAAGMNLLDFFTKWGFLTPVDVTINDYGVGRMNVTKERIANIRRKVEALGYPEPEIALEYITDNNYSLYKTKPTIVPGTSSRSGSVLTMKNWKNVAVYEVKNKDNRLIFVSEGMTSPSETASFTIPVDWDDSFSVYAVSASGERVQVSL